MDEPTPPSTDPPGAKIGAHLGDGVFAVERTGAPSTDPPDFGEMSAAARHHYWRERCVALESALRPLVADPTVEKVREAVGHYVEAREVLLEGEVETWCSERAVKWVDADAARKDHNAK